MYKLFKCNYTIGKSTASNTLIFNAIGYLTHTISFKIPLRVDVKLLFRFKAL